MILLYWFKLTPLWSIMHRYSSIIIHNNNKTFKHYLSPYGNSLNTFFIYVFKCLFYFIKCWIFTVFLCKYSKTAYFLNLSAVFFLHALTCMTFSWQWLFRWYLCFKLTVSFCGQVSTPPSVSTQSQNGIYRAWNCSSWLPKTWRSSASRRLDTRRWFWRLWRSSALWWVRLK